MMVIRTCMATAALLALAITTSDAQDYSGREQLRAQSEQFRPEVIQVASGVFVAVGYAASNVVLVQGSDGSIIVDTATDPVAARAIVEAFGSRLRRPRGR